MPPLALALLLYWFEQGSRDWRMDQMHEPVSFLANLGVHSRLEHGGKRSVTAGNSAGQNGSRGTHLEVLLHYSMILQKTLLMPSWMADDVSFMSN